MAIGLLGITPGEFMDMDRLEQELVSQAAVELEKSRWKRLSKILGG